MISTQIIEEWVDSDYIDRLAADMEENGQREPIKLRFCGNHYFLEDGAHRFFAARKLRWLEIGAVLVKINPHPKLREPRLVVQDGSPKLKKPVNDYWALVLQGKREHKTGVRIG